MELVWECIPALPALLGEEGVDEFCADAHCVLNVFLFFMYKVFQSPMIVFTPGIGTVVSNTVMAFNKILVTNMTYKMRAVNGDTCTSAEIPNRYTVYLIIISRVVTATSNPAVYRLCT